MEVAADRGWRDAELVVVLQVPGDGVGSGVESFAGQGVAQLDDQIEAVCGSRVGLVCGRRDRGSKAASPSRV